MKKLILTTLLLGALALGAGKANAQEAKNNTLIIDETVTEQVEEGENPRFFGGVGALYKTWVGGISPTINFGIEAKHAMAEIFYIPPIKHSKFFNEFSYWDDNLDSTLTERGVLTSKLNTIGWNLSAFPLSFEKFKIGIGGEYCWGKETADLIDTKTKLEGSRSYFIPILTAKAKISEKISLNLRYSFDGPEPMGGPEFGAGVTTPLYSADKFLTSIDQFISDTSYKNSWVGVGMVYKTWAGGTSPIISIGGELRHTGIEFSFIPGIESSKHYPEIEYLDDVGSLIKAEGIVNSKINTLEWFNPYIGFKNFKLGAALGYSWGKQEIYLPNTKETVGGPVEYGSLSFKAKVNLFERWGLTARLSYGPYISMDGPELGLSVNKSIN